ncbi:Uncharacterised protein [Legionella steigerwaltii]|uniref:Uncharacterized protein n=1 Tax=Legionella steigerwaltii TaxID=460 RepID=A0A378LD46_9GAMM|nr:hypothetical protein [Legionella steigerwaltii]KTD79538.1 hypothetical protein Lstg_0754 [Legionella steigerwaltii]STY24577.1 Uncharacterised protein [Legionella steigerwaltii]
MLKQKSNPDQQQKRLAQVGLKRQLSVSYIGPKGQITCDDPDSYSGQERIAYQNALIRQHPETGYADGILERREEQRARFFSQQKEEEKAKPATAPALR